MDTIALFKVYIKVPPQDEVTYPPSTSVGISKHKQRCNKISYDDTFVNSGL